MRLHNTQGICLKQPQCLVAPCTLQVTDWAPRNSVSFPSCSIMSEPAAVMSLRVFQQPGKSGFHPWERNAACSSSSSTSRNALESLYKTHYFPFSWWAYVHIPCYLCMNHSHGSVFVDWVFGTCLHTASVTPRGPRISQHWQIPLCWPTSIHLWGLWHFKLRSKFIWHQISEQRRE